MVTQNLSFIFFFISTILLIIDTEVVHSSPHGHNRVHKAKKLFVFGDSYADTGNSRKSDSRSWNEPYGITFPGKPSGRYSDGRVFTDFLARTLGVKTPIAYKWRKYKQGQIQNGMNFAYGGTGVFDTMAPYPNMTTQIDIFEQLVNQSVFTYSELRNSVAHVSLAGNDYSNFLATRGSLQEITKFIPQVVKQLEINLVRIYKLGVKKITVTSLQPLGCLPQATFETSFQKCNSTANSAVKLHNLLLQVIVTKLNVHFHYNNPFVIIDFYNKFSIIIGDKGVRQGNCSFENPLKPCCMGINGTLNECGNVDAQGNKLYTICQNPTSYFFWDHVHLTQAGWHAIALSLQSTLQQLAN
ncbi:hypothetical protein RND81_01G019500 [Saponaria officinalis]|uniref:Uncharacterized protein n=1 Tax=Saponaria officinalis TaxID=3572 RepID=A0AAW1NFH6_SAPOF